MEFAVGDIVEGIVTGITKFGAFVELPGKKVGLVHISEVADSYVKEVGDFIKEKDSVKVKVISIEESGKISLSIKKAKAPAPRPKSFESPATFDDMLNRFMKDSNEKLGELKRHQEGRKSGK